MKILYANQVFLDYRIPYYQKLIQLFKGNFYVMYSPNRYHLMKRDDLVERIKSEMGDNAVAFNHDYLFDHNVNTEELDNAIEIVNTSLNIGNEALALAAKATP